MRVKPCRRGHPRNEKTTYVSPDGKMVCRACKAMRDAEYYQRNKVRIKERNLKLKYERAIEGGVIAKVMP